METSKLGLIKPEQDFEIEQKYWSIFFWLIKWNSTKSFQVGMWAFKCTKSNDWIVAYTQDPGANLIGDWKNNVGRPKNC